ncbi:unnamed protein product [Prunus armeniaca]
MHYVKKWSMQTLGLSLPKSSRLRVDPSLGRLLIRSTLIYTLQTGFQSREPPKTLQKCHDPLQGKQRADVQGVCNDLAKGHPRLVPHPSIQKSDESFRDYIKRFKAEKANIVGCDDRIASSTFKKGLLAEHDLYRELTITPSQILAEVFEIAERYTLWDDERIAAKNSTKQEDQPTKQAGQRSDGFSNRNKDKCRSHPQGDATAGENYTKFTIPIHQILAQVKDKPWVRRQPPSKWDLNKRDTRKYRAFHRMHGHTTHGHLEELVIEGHCMEFVVKQAV